MVVRKEITNGMNVCHGRSYNQQNGGTGAERATGHGGRKSSQVFAGNLKRQLLEQKENLKSGADNAVETVDKPIAVVGGFGNKTLSCGENCLLVWIGLMVCCYLWLITAKWWASQLTPQGKQCNLSSPAKK